MADFCLRRRVLTFGSVPAWVLVLAGSALAQDGQRLDANASPSATGPFLNIWSAGNSTSQSNQFAHSVAQLPTGTLIAIGGDSFLKNSCRMFGGMWFNAVNPSGGSKVLQQLWANCSQAAQGATTFEQLPMGDLLSQAKIIPLLSALANRVPC